MKEVFIIMILVLLATSLEAQNASIKAKKTKWKIGVNSADSILWIGFENILTVNIEGGSNFLVEIKDARWRVVENKYLVQVFAEGAVTFTVYEKLPNKKMRPVYTKIYEVKKIPDPIVYVCGVKKDSVIDKQQIIKDNILTAISSFYKKQLPVLGFDVIFPFGEDGDTLTSANNQFTLDMKRRIHYLTPGSILYFDNVYCALPDGKIQKLKPFEIFIDETNKYNVGYRVITKQ